MDIFRFICPTFYKWGKSREKSWFLFRDHFLWTIKTAEIKVDEKFPPILIFFFLAWL